MRLSKNVIVGNTAQIVLEKKQNDNSKWKCKNHRRRVKRLVPHFISSCWSTWLLQILLLYQTSCWKFPSKSCLHVFGASSFMVWIDISHDSVGYYIYSFANFVYKFLARLCNFANATLNDLLEMIFSSGKMTTFFYFPAKNLGGRRTYLGSTWTICT